MSRTDEGRSRTVSIREIDPNPFYDVSRLVPGKVGHFAGAVEHMGFVYWATAVREKDGRFQNVCDHERYYALHKLGVTEVPVSVVALTDAQMKKASTRF